MLKSVCPHCHATLRLQNANLIGQTKACPKCRKTFVLQPANDATRESSSPAPSRQRPRPAEVATDNDFADLTNLPHPNVPISAPSQLPQSAAWASYAQPIPAESREHHSGALSSHVLMALGGVVLLAGLTVSAIVGVALVRGVGSVAVNVKTTVKQADATDSLAELSIAMAMAMKENRVLPGPDGPGVDSPEVPHGNLSWRVHLLPYLGEEALYKRFRLDEPWNSSHNIALVKQMPTVFGSNSEGKTAFHVLVGEHAMFSMGRGTGIREIQDGTANTLLIVLAGDDKADVWTKPGGLPYDADVPVDPTSILGRPPTEDGWQYVCLFWSTSEIGGIVPTDSSKPVQVQGTLTAGVIPTDIDKQQFQALCGKDEGIRPVDGAVLTTEVHRFHDHHGREHVFVPESDWIRP